MLRLLAAVALIVGYLGTASDTYAAKNGDSKGNDNSGDGGGTIPTIADDASSALVIASFIARSAKVLSKLSPDEPQEVFQGSNG